MSHPVYVTSVLKPTIQPRGVLCQRLFLDQGTSHPQLFLLSKVLLLQLPNNRYIASVVPLPGLNPNCMFLSSWTRLLIRFSIDSFQSRAFKYLIQELLFLCMNHTHCNSITFYHLYTLTMATAFPVLRNFSLTSVWSVTDGPSGWILDSCILHDHA